jgi:hypothetical protein
MRNLSIITMVILLAGCATPGYVLEYNDKKNNGTYICTHKEDTPSYYGRTYPYSYFEDEEIGAKAACQKDLAKTKGKYRCEDYVTRTYHGSSKYDGLGWGSRRYDMCVADGRSNCYDNSYPFAKCIAAKCSYKAKELALGSNGDAEDWITKADWDDCASRR